MGCAFGAVCKRSCENQGRLGFPEVHSFTLHVQDWGPSGADVRGGHEVCVLTHAVACGCPVAPAPLAEDLCPVMLSSLLCHRSADGICGVCFRSFAFLAPQPHAVIAVPPEHVGEGAGGGGWPCRGGLFHMGRAVLGLLPLHGV